MRSKGEKGETKMKPRYEIMIEEMMLNLINQDYWIFSWGSSQHSYVLTRQLAHYIVREVHKR